MLSRSLSPTFTLPSPETGTSYLVYVEAPPPGAGKGPWPVVLFMDGDDQFRYAVKAYEAAREANSVAPLILVGVGYGSSYGKPGNGRIRDYTPTPLATEGESGKATPFVNFLTKTLWRELENRYPVKNEARGLAGHSLGSLLAVEALFQGSGFFDRILASSPSLWWDDRSVFKTVMALHARRPTLKARLYLSVGLKDTPSMTGDLELLRALLSEQTFKGLEILYQAFDERDHYNVLVDAFQAGLTALYA